jgi:hypothetical protein
MQRLPDLSATASAAPLDDFAATSPRPDARHVTGRYHGRAVDITVRHDMVSEGSHLVVVVHDMDPDGFERRAEYLVDYVDLDDGIRMGVEVARALVDGRLH